MKEISGLNPVTRGAISALLGPALDPSSQTTSIVNTVDDHLFLWNAREQSVLAVNMSCRGENKIQTLNLADCPQHTVSGLSVSKSARWLAVYGEDGVTAVEVPRRSGGDGRFGGGDAELLCRSISVYRERDDRKVQKGSWHPGSPGENHLLVLTTDGSLTLYFVGETSSRVFHQVNLGGSRVETALGETAVDFCFGASVEREDGNIWPIFVLWADGDVFYVNADLAEEWRVEGPVEVNPPQSTDFSIESCSVLAVGGKTGPPVLVIAQVGGNILHHVMLGEPGGRISLHLYQQVVLDLGPLNSTDSVFSCPVRLISDSSNKSRYLALHGSGLHQVELPITESEDLIDTDLQCIVEHLICTRPTLDSTPAPLLGASVYYPPATLVCLMADHSIHTLKSKPSASFSASSITENSKDETLQSYSSSSDSIEDRVKSIFSRDSTQPLIISAPGTNVTQTETLELLCRATETLKAEYICKIVKARDELASEIKLLKGKKSSQETLLRKLETTRTELRKNAESLSEKYEDVKDRGSDLMARVESVLSRVQTRAPTASDAELKMARDLKMLKNKMEQMKVATEQLKEKDKYQKYQMENVREDSKQCSLTGDQVENLKEVLQGDSLIITDLVKQISSARKDIAL